MSDASPPNEETPLPARLVENDESPSPPAAPTAPNFDERPETAPLDLFGSSEPTPPQPPRNPAESHRRMVGAEHAEPRKRRVGLPVILFLLTCLSTFWAGCAPARPEALIEYFTGGTNVDIRDAIIANWQNGLIYMACVLAILFTHEMGHFVMTLRYRIAASWPYFLPVPFTPIGTMGAVISMDGLSANRRQIFDIGIAGPLAGLVVAIPITWYGVTLLDNDIAKLNYNSAYLEGVHPDWTDVPADSSAEQRAQLQKQRQAEIAQYEYTYNDGFGYHMPRLVLAMAARSQPDISPGTIERLPTSMMNPFLMAGWVGLLITGLNMMPISQLDGGHVIYALFGKRAHVIARLCLFVAIAAVVIYFDEVFFWMVMLVLVTLMGTDHPPTADDDVPLGLFRTLLGWASLSIPFLCFPFLGFLPLAM